MKIAHIKKETNELLGWYDSNIHKTIPTPNIEISDEQWQIALDNKHNKINNDGSTQLFDFRTEEEKAAQMNYIKLAESKDYLASTDYKVLPDYDGDATGILEARKEARATIRKIEGTV